MKTTTDARAVRRRRQLRFNRLLLGGSLGSLALFLGIIVAQDAVAPDPPVSMDSQQVQQQPRIRTRTS
jgi:hypothetical protein